MNPMPTSLTPVAVAVALALFSRAAFAQDQAIVVQAGQLLSGRAIGPHWSREGKALCGGGEDHRILAKAVLGPGDFEIRARLSLERIAGTAATLMLGPNDHFGFDGRPERFFVEGPLFGGLQHLAMTRDHIEPGVPFDLICSRQDGQLEIRIGEAVLFQREIANAASFEVGLRPWRNRMAIESFAIRGNLQEGPLSLYEHPGHRIVFRASEGSHHTYRIPAIVRTAKGTLLAFAEGRRDGEGDAGNIDLVLRRSLDGGNTWGPIQTVWDDGPHTCGNPAPVFDRQSGRILLLATWSRGDDPESAIIAGTSRDTRRVFCLHSDDEGLSWSSAREITAMAKMSTWTWYATGPGNGIQLSERSPHPGRLVIPCDHIEQETKLYRSHCLLSDDGGATWTTSEPAPKPQVNECAVAELSDGRLLLNMRNYDRRHKARAIAFSRDGGQSFADQSHDATLIEPICQASLIALGAPPHQALLFSNPASETQRKTLRVRLSLDDGATWPIDTVLHPGPAAYSCLTALGGGRAGCLFEAGDHHPYEAIVWRELPFALAAAP